MKANEVRCTIDPLEQYSSVPHERLIQAMGELPWYVSEKDPRPAQLQFEANYKFGTHWIDGFDMTPDGTLVYPGDPALFPIGRMVFATETVFFYPHAWVAIIQNNDPDNFVVARFD